jgi:hypothetical protein
MKRQSASPLCCLNACRTQNGLLPQVENKGLCTSWSTVCQLKVSTCVPIDRPVAFALHLHEMRVNIVSLALCKAQRYAQGQSGLTSGQCSSLTMAAAPESPCPLPRQVQMR